MNVEDIKKANEALLKIDKLNTLEEVVAQFGREISTWNREGFITIKSEDGHKSSVSLYEHVGMLIGVIFKIIDRDRAEYEKELEALGVDFTSAEQPKSQAS